MLLHTVAQMARQWAIALPQSRNISGISAGSWIAHAQNRLTVTAPWAGINLPQQRSLVDRLAMLPRHRAGRALLAAEKGCRR